MGWLQGVGLNLALAIIYRLVLWPLAPDAHYDALLRHLVYFSTFVMADVTTTNVFGHDMVRTNQALRDGDRFRTILLRKNLVQFLVIMLPVPILTAGGTEYLYHHSEMERTIPGVLYPMLLFLGIGNLISVLYPVAPAPVAWRLKTWRQWRLHAPMLTSYAIPYVIYAVWVYTDLPGLLNNLLFAVSSDAIVLRWEQGLVLLLVSVVLYVLLTSAAVAVFRRRGLKVSGLHTASGQPGDDAPLERQDHDDQRDSDQRASSHD
ncbi:MAG: hypothetical protein Q4A82_00335 [Corynebacterium sp.]|nr:hypothetical protein [Corynebacterium sp.]